MRAVIFAVLLNLASAKVSVMWIRHGFSCGNAVSAFDKKGHADGNTKVKYVIHDPPLTDCAVGASDAAKVPIKPDVVIASTLIRAQETAILLFPGHEVIVAPYINEVYPQFACNQPWSVKDQAAWIQNHTDLHIGGVPKVNYTIAGAGPVAPNFGAFLQLLPSLLPGKGTTDLVVAVASHSQFLEQSLLPICGKKIGFENEMVVQVDFNLVNGSLAPVTPAACTTVFPGAAQPTQFGLCPAEVARCSEVVRDTVINITNCTCPKVPSQSTVVV